MGILDLFFGSNNVDPNTGYAYPSSVQRRAPAPVSAAPGDVQKPFGDTTISGKYPGRLVPTLGPGPLTVTQEVGGAAPGQAAPAQDATRMVRTQTFNPQTALVARPSFTAFARPVNPVMMAMPQPRPDIPAAPQFAARLPADPRAWFGRNPGPDTVRAYAPVPQAPAAQPAASSSSSSLGRVLAPATVTRTARTPQSRKTQAGSVSVGKPSMAAAPAPAPVPVSSGGGGNGNASGGMFSKAGGPSPGSTQTKSFTSTRPSANASVSKSSSGSTSRSTTTKR